MAGQGSSTTESTGQVINVQLERSVALQLLQALSIATGVPCAKAKGSKGGKGGGGKSEAKSSGKSEPKSTGKAEVGKSEGKAG